MTSPAAIVVERLSSATCGEYVAFFDHERGAAFSNNPEWARCYCQFYRIPRALDWTAFSAEQNRTAIEAAIACGEAEGYLARAQGTTVGWINAQPRHKLPHCFERMRIPLTPIDVAAHDAAVIVCFVIAPQWRRLGVASALLDGALADLAARGIVLVDAFPFKSGDSADPTDHYHGPASLFASRGFAAIAEHPDLTVMRKRLNDTVALPAP